MLRSLPVVVALASALVFAAPAQADFESAKGFFQEGVKSPDWKVRRNAYGALADHDGGPGAALVLAGLATEQHPAVESAAVAVLAGMRSEPARAAVIAAFQKSKPSERLHAALALSGMKGNDVDAALLDALASGPAPLATQAALALGQPGRSSASAPLTKALAHEAWQVRAAAARSLGALGDRAAGSPLAERLKTERGRVRAETIAALEAISRLRLGDSPKKWAAWAAGGDPALVEEKPALAPTFFGVPVTGERVALVLDRSLNMRDPHPFTGPEQKDRLASICTPPDGDRIAWRQLKTKWQLAAAHANHVVDGLPSGSKVEVLYFAADVQGVFLKKLTPVGSAMRNALAAALAAVETDDGIAIYDALVAALDLGGPTDEKAWKFGPDQVLFVTNNVPTAGEVKEADVIASAVSFLARRRFVPISAVGIGNHPFDLARGIAQKTGGVYVDLSK